MQKAFFCGCAEGMGVTAITDVHLEVEIAISPWNSHWFRLLQNRAGNLTGWKIQSNTDLRGCFIGHLTKHVARRLAPLFLCPLRLQSSFHYFITFALFSSSSSFSPLLRPKCKVCSGVYSEISCVQSWHLDLRLAQEESLWNVQKERDVSWEHEYENLK